MRARRFCATLLALFMMHLTFVGADWACAQHRDASARGSHHVMTGQDQTAAAISHEVAPVSDLPCQTPTQPECCRAMTSCAISATFATSGMLSEASPLRVRIASGPSDVPPSRISGPEPPPPKA